MEKKYAEKYCPFCGGKLEIFYIPASTWMFVCEDCEVSSKPYTSEEDCLKAANTQHVCSKSND